jgi:glutamate carboxypeptidase
VNLLESVGAEELTGSTLERLRRLVELESPSGDEVGLRAVAAELALQLAGAGGDVDTVDVEGVGEHVVGRFPGDGGEVGELDPLLVLGHLDTVHPVGSFSPTFQVAGGRARGPGVFDMKGGLACMLEALDRLRRAGQRPRRAVTVLATCDEETGSGSSRVLIEELARGAGAVLVPEPPLPGGGAKTRRKGIAVYRLRVTGRASHAGLAPQDGINAVVELAHQVLSITGLADPAAGTTATVTTIRGGTATNVVPAEAVAEVDVRFTAASEAARMDEAIRALEPRLGGVRLEVTGGVNRAPMERTAGVAALYQEARRLAAAAGWELAEGLAGGASDGSLTAGLGIPTLDGIGPEGGGAHAPDEHVLVADLPRRVHLYAGLLVSL